MLLATLDGCFPLSWVGRLTFTRSSLTSIFDLTASIRFGQDGTSAPDKLQGVAVTEDNSIVAAGWTEGNWGGENAGLADFMALKLRSGAGYMLVCKRLQDCYLRGWSRYNVAMRKICIYPVLANPVGRFVVLSIRVLSPTILIFTGNASSSEGEELWRWQVSCWSSISS